MSSFLTFRTVLRCTSIALTRSRLLHTTPRRFAEGRGGSKEPFVNIFAGDVPPPVQVTSISKEGIELADGLSLPSACMFIDGKVFLWDVPTTLWEGWGKERFEIFEVVVPKPDILLLGTGNTLSMPPPSLRMYLNQIGIQMDVMDTRNASSTYNLLAEEGRRVAAALLPLSKQAWDKRST